MECLFLTWSTRGENLSPQDKNSGTIREWEKNTLSSRNIELSQSSQEILERVVLAGKIRKVGEWIHQHFAPKFGSSPEISKLKMVQSKKLNLQVFARRLTNIDLNWFCKKLAKRELA